MGGPDAGHGGTWNGRFRTPAEFLSEVDFLVDASRSSLCGSFDIDSNAGGNFLHKANHVPICNSHATVAECSADRVRLVCAVNTDAGFVERAPHNADRIVRAGWEHVKIICADTVI